MDDAMTTGRLLARRRALAMLGASGAALLVARHGAAAAVDAPLPACVVRPRQTEGPFFVDGDLERSDLRIDPRTGAVKPGVPLRLAFRVSRVGASACAPLAGAQVHVWHCDAAGDYSSVRDPRAPKAGEAFLRGFQKTDAAGTARFLTIYPGWYPGRAVHVHFKIRTADAPRSAEFTSQLYFDEALSERVYATAPYASRGRRSSPTATTSCFATAAGNFCSTSHRRPQATPPCSTSVCKPSLPRSRDAVRIELQRLEPGAEQNDMAGAAMHPVVGKLERKRSAKAQQALRVSSEAGTRALHGIVEKLQALRPARFARCLRRRLARPQRIERDPAAQRNDDQYDDLRHANPPFARSATGPAPDVDMGAGAGNASRGALGPTGGCAYSRAS